MKLYVFNPETDMALANFQANYIPPAPIRRMAEELAMFPIWYAEPGSAVLAPSAYNQEFLQKMQRLFPLPVQLLTKPELAAHPDMQVLPWGWNPAFRRQMLDAGISACRLPAGEQLEHWRKLSGRHVAVELLKAFRDMEECCGSAACLLTPDACRRYADEVGACLFKAPWSGSGKGLMWCRNGFDRITDAWCRRVHAEQGFIVGMPIYDKVCDFAMEFYSDGHGKVLFTGYSQFKTNAKGAYMGNSLEPDERIEQRLSGFIPLASLVRVRLRLQELLAGYFAGYTGYLGVDMMVCREPSGAASRYALFPCVEVNMRMNMGVFSRLFHDRFMHPAACGKFRIEAYATPEELWQVHEAELAALPLRVSDGRLLSGYLPLVPVTPHSRYRAYVFAWS